MALVRELLDSSEAQAVQAELDAKRTEFRERMDRVQQRDAALKQQCAELNERLVRLYRFIQENDIKRTRAERKAVAEQKVTEERRDQCSSLVLEIAAHDARRAELRAKLEKYARYQRYLEDVLLVNEEFQTAADVVARHATLDGNTRELQARKRDLEASIEAAKMTLARRRKHLEDEVLDAGNTLTKLKAEIEATTKTSVAAGDALESSAEARAAALKTVGAVKLATHALFLQCAALNRAFRRSHGAGDVVAMDVFAQLAYIADSVGDYVVIVERDAERRREKERAAADAG